jgi:hypothetical protein
MSYGILATVLDRLRKYGELSVHADLGTLHLALTEHDGEIRTIPTAIEMVERPPMRTVPEYVSKFLNGEGKDAR